MNSAFLQDRVFTVSEIGLIIKETVGEMFYGLQVEGEVCNFRTNQSRHWYFSIKDKDGSILNCTCFAGNNWKERKPENGELVVLKGSLSFWPKGGSLTFNAESIRKKGEGDLRAEIEKRRAYYKALGYFDDENKAPLPKEIKTIGIVTSKDGAVIHDIMRITRRRAPSINLLLFPSLVQGKGAELSIASRIRQANNFEACDVLIVGRGGGSEEDLAAYSTDEVIEAIHESKIPIVSAVGHDSDFPLSDFVATLRASTPSAAAEILTEDAFKKRAEVKEIQKTLNEAINSLIKERKMDLLKLKADNSFIFIRIERAKAIIQNAKSAERNLKMRITGYSYEKANLDNIAERAISERIAKTKSVLLSINSDLRVSLKEIKSEMKIKLNSLDSSSKESINRLLRDNKKKVELLSSRLEDLSPLSILERGYTIIKNSDGKIVRSINDVKLSSSIVLRLKDGKIKANVEEKSEL